MYKEEKSPRKTAVSEKEFSRMIKLKKRAIILNKLANLQQSCDYLQLENRR